MSSTYFHSSLLAATLFSVTLTAPAFASENTQTHQRLLRQKNLSQQRTLSRKNEESYWGKFKRNLTQTWDNDQYNYYLMVWTWHNRFTYDKENQSL